MEQLTIRLGVCMVLDLHRARLSEMIDIIEGFGLTYQELFRINPTTQDITEIHDAIIGYRKAVKYLRGLKERIAY